MDTERFIFAFSITLLAGLATAVGAVLAFFRRSTDTQFLSISLGLSAGVMLYVSFMELMPLAQSSLSEALGKGIGNWVAIGAFFSGIILIGLIDRLVPSGENPHTVRLVEEIAGAPLKIAKSDVKSLKRVGLMTAFAIAIHNFPEGLATFTAAVTDTSLGVAIASAVAIHNVPEGIAVSVPIYYATGDRKKAFLYALLSGLAEPVGALVGFALLMPFLSPLVMGALFGVVSGIMVFISLDELLPAAEEYGEHHLCIYGLVIGMALMAVSLQLLS